MPRSHRRHYIPCWYTLLSEYEESGCHVTTYRLMKLLDEEKRIRWKLAIDKLCFTHTSRKSWDLLRKLGSAQPALCSCIVTEKLTQTTFLKLQTLSPLIKKKILINDKYKAELFNKFDEKTASMDDFSAKEVDLAIKSVKNSKATGGMG